MQRRILLADVPELEEFLRSCFPQREIAYVSDFTGAVRTLAMEDFALIVIGMHFDDSQMFPLLRYIKNTRKHERTPVVCIRAMPSALSSSAKIGIEHAAKALGADAFIDLAPDTAAAKNLCAMLDRHISDADDRSIKDSTA